MSGVNDFDMKIPELTIDAEPEKGTDVSDPSVAAIIESVDFTNEEIEQIKKFADSVDLSDPNSVVNYGAGAQQRLADFSDTAISNVRTKDANEIGDMLSKLVADLKYTPDDRKGLRGLLKKGAHKIEDIKAHYSKIDTNVDTVSKVLKKHETTLVKDIAILERLFEKNNLFYKEITMYIAAGKMALNKAVNEDLPELNAKANETGNPTDVQKARDFSDMCDRFELKLNDLEISRTICIQNAPQIRLVQNNDMMMVDKIKSAIVNVIPLWKNQMLLAMGMAHSQDAIKAGSIVSNATNDLLKANADLLQQTTTEAAKESNRNIVDIETLQYTNDKLIATLEELSQINTENRENRKNVETELVRIETELKNKVMEISTGRENG